MKLTDFALIFVAVFLPVVIIVYVNTSFVIKTEKNEMYYKNLINAATEDAVFAMKQVENSNIDYGYSGIVEGKVSINAKQAVDTFYNSLATNLKIEGDTQAIESLKMYIPVIAILDYDGIYIHSIEELQDGRLEFVTKPKIRYTTTYAIQETGIYLGNRQYKVIDVAKENLVNILDNYIYEITYTMDDYVYLNIYKDNNIIYSKNFYLTDSLNNEALVYTEQLASDEEKELRTKVIDYLQANKQEIIANLSMKHISYAINKHNEYARLSGIKYQFHLSATSDDSWYETINGIGMIAVIQGISLGNRELDYSAYSSTGLKSVKRYYVSIALKEDIDSINNSINNKHYEEMSYLKHNLYHSSENCMVYKYYLDNVDMYDKASPAYYITKSDAATQGYYQCPVCKP